MSSPPTLDQDRGRWGPDDHPGWDQAGVNAHLAAHHPQVRSWPDDNPYAAHDSDHRDWIYDHPHPARDREAHEQADEAFTQLNPAFGIPSRSDDLVSRAQAQALEDQGSRGPRARFAELLENDQPTSADRRRVIARRVELAQQHGRQQAALTRAEGAFDRLNPDFGVPADHSHRIGHRDVQQREAALTLGVRVAIHDSRQNDRDPVIWQPGQDYRAADAIQAARHQPARTRHGPERTGAER